jgi:hypothetical protein
LGHENFEALIAKATPEECVEMLAKLSLLNDPRAQAASRIIMDRQTKDYYETDDKKAA